MKRRVHKPVEADVLQKLKWRGDAALHDLWQIANDMRLYASTLHRDRFGLADADLPVE